MGSNSATPPTVPLEPGETIEVTQTDPAADGPGSPPREPEAQQVSGVAIIAKPLAGGGFEVDVQALGDTRVTEIDTLLTMARKKFRAQNGLD